MLSAVLLIFSFQFSLLSSIYRSASRTSTAAYYWTSDVAENLGEYLSGRQRTTQRKDFEVILTVKVVTIDTP